MRLLCQLVEIIKVVGTPTREEIQAMNQNYTEFKFPQIKAHPWSKVPANPSPAVHRLARTSGSLPLAVTSFWLHCGACPMAVMLSTEPLQACTVDS